MGSVRAPKIAFGILFLHVIICTVVLYNYLHGNHARNIFNLRIVSRAISVGEFLGIKNMTKCEMVLDEWYTEIPVLLIDSEFLNDMKSSGCSRNNKLIKIGVDAKYRSDGPIFDENRFQVVYYTNNVSKDFLDFDVDGRRIIPKQFETRWVGNFEIPSDIVKFLGFWKRSKLVNCLGLKVKRKISKPLKMPAEPSTKVLARLRNELMDNNMFPFLNGGTLLGWYRECSLIPHSSNMDLAISYDDYNPEYLKKLEKDESSFRIIRKLGRVNDSFEMTMVPKRELRSQIDIFLMYDGIENGTITHSYVSGLAEDGVKYKYPYPVYDPWCAAELHNHIFWVTCTPKEKIIFEYGGLWYLDGPSAIYSRNESSKNLRPDGELTARDRKKVSVV